MIRASDITKSVQLASSWLFRASSVFPDNGVAQYFNPNENWTQPAPGLTGEAIAVQLALSQTFDSPSISEHAIRLAHWLSSRQLDCGALQEGRIDEPAVPSIIQTGRGVIGWTAAYMYTEEETFLIDALRAAEWICAMQHGSGAWRSNMGEPHGGITTAFSIRVVRPLLELWRLTGMERFRATSVKALDWCLENRGRVGWFLYNSLDEKSTDATLNHIVWCLEGLLYGGIYLQDRRYSDAVEQCAEQLLKWQRASGDLPRKYNHSFRPVTPKHSAQSIAQMAGIWCELSAHTGTDRYFDAAQKAGVFLRSLQHGPAAAPTIRGSLPFERNARTCPVEAVLSFIQSQLLELAFIKKEQSDNES